MRGVLWVVVSLLSTPVARAVDFSRDVEPIFRSRCQPCHGSATQMNGLRLDGGEAALRGGYSGPVIVAGNSGASKLIARVTSVDKARRMPPTGAALAEREIAALRAWIDEGAKWAGASATTASGRAGHWSLQPIAKPAVPAVRQAKWVRTPVDAYVLARLERENIKPSPEAPKHVLIRRLSLDLTGLPPTPAEVAAYLADSRPGAYERLVDRLLASPHYGERWARPWLDLARYADSDGYEKDQVRAYAWRYRQWVIEALNRDLPFDQFTRQQLAGDLLANAGAEERVATGFQRNTLTNREAGVDRAEARFEQLVNRTNTLGTVWLGLTVGCAQCHDHKYDPFSQRDYYQLMAFFESSMEDDIDAPLPGEWERYRAARPAYEEQHRALVDEYGVPALQAHWEDKIREAIAQPGKDLEWDFNVTSMRAMLDHAERLLHTDPRERTGRQQERLTDYFISSPGPDLGRDKAARDKLKELEKKLRALSGTLPPLAEAQVLVEDTRATKAHIHLKGDYKALGVEVGPDAPSVLPRLGAGAPHNRLGLAEWLVSRDNPLTARVAVNRAWQELFGRGLVRTSEDFGVTGEKPSHPELLDWMAADFMDRGWSLKRLHKLIVTSATYRQSSAARPELAERDPENALLARQSRIRLPAELIRDEALASSGLLNPAIGGKSVRPPQPAGLAELGYGGNVKWKESEGADRYRRGLYILFQRTVPYPQLMTFDSPDSNVSCSRRRRSNTALQALNLLNDPVFFEAARAFAARVLRETPATAGFARRLDYAYALALGRKPERREVERLGRYFDEQCTTLGAAESDAWVGVGRVLLNLDEFITRE